MRIETFFVKHFRSIETIQVPSVTDFNVLIGKNNAGKSNILSSIESLFTTASNNQLMNIEPPIGEKLDYFNKDSKLPIEISIIFTINQGERDAISSYIALEAPNMANALDGLDSSTRLLLTLCVVAQPHKHAYFKKIAFVKPYDIAHKNNPVTERLILVCEANTASEIFTRESALDKYRKESESLDQMIHSSTRDLRGYFERSKGDRIPLSMWSNSKSTPEAERLWKTSNTYDEFVSSIQGLINTNNEQAEEIRAKPLTNKIRTFSGDEQSIPRYVNEIIRLVSNTKVLHLTERRQQIGRNEASALLNLKITRGGPDKLKSIQTTVESLLGVKIDAFQSEGSTDRDRTAAEIDVDDFLVQANGSGIREALRIILDVELKQPEIVLIEEPEVFLHPGLEQSLMAYLKSLRDNHQVIISTHSTNFIDTAEDSGLFLVSKKTGSTSILKVDINQVEALVPKEIGMRLSSFFIYDKLIFVEGPTDEAILRKFGNTLGCDFVQQNVGFIPIGGSRNLSYFANDTTLSFLSRRQIKTVFVLDRDEKNKTDLDKIQKILAGKTQLHIFSKRELENYLINSRSIGEFIKDRLLSSGQKAVEPPTTSEIEKQIMEKANTLKQFVISKRVEKQICNPIYLNTGYDYMKSGINEALKERIVAVIAQLNSSAAAVQDLYEKTAKEVDEIWKTEKLSLVPGDLLLDLVLQSYNLRYVKTDGVKLASYFNQNEIDSDIKTLFANIKA